MSFFNRLSIRLPLAVIGGILYGLLSYSIVIFLDLSPEVAILAAAFVFFFYLGTRLLIRRGEKSPRHQPLKRTPWVKRPDGSGDFTTIMISSFLPF